MKMSEFFLIISPSQKVMKFVSELKERTREIIGHRFRSEFSKAHISLFKYEDSYTDSMLYRIDDVTSQITPFNIYLDGFGFFNNGSSKTIYLNILYKSPLSRLSKRLIGKEILPHITIARDLRSDDFDNIWNKLRNIPYREQFLCDRITVLKRVSNHWSQYTELGFRCN